MKYLAILVVAAVLAGCGLIQVSQPTASKLAAQEGFHWRTDSTAHFTVYYEADSPGQARLNQINQDAEASLDHILTLLNVRAYDRPLHLFVVSSRQRMRQLVGRETNGTAFHRTGVLVFIVSADMRLGARHELLHVVAMNLWGVPEPWVNEGLAVYADDHWHGYDLHALVRHLEGNAHVLPLEVLIERFRRHDDRITYPQAGSFVKFLYETYGVKAVRELWERGREAVEEATGRTLPELESEWLTVVRTAEASGIEYMVE